MTYWDITNIVPPLLFEISLLNNFTRLDNICNLIIIRVCKLCPFSLCPPPPPPHPVDGGQRAVIFDRFRGVLPTVSSEGTHFLVPWVQKPIIFSIRSRPRRIPVVTGSKGQSTNVPAGGRAKLVVWLLNFRQV